MSQQDIDLPEITSNNLEKDWYVMDEKIIIMTKKIGY